MCIPRVIVEFGKNIHNRTLKYPYPSWKSLYLSAQVIDRSANDPRPAEMIFQLEIIFLKNRVTVWSLGSKIPSILTRVICLIYDDQLVYTFRNLSSAFSQIILLN